MFFRIKFFKKQLWVYIPIEGILIEKKCYIDIENTTSEYETSLKSSNWREMFSHELNIHGEQRLYLKGLRTRDGYTQAELGALIGVLASNISAMERGRRSIGRKTAQRLAGVFKVSYRNFL